MFELPSPKSNEQVDRLNDITGIKAIADFLAATVLPGQYVALTLSGDTPRAFQGVFLAIDQRRNVAAFSDSTRGEVLGVPPPTLLLTDPV